MSLQAWKRIEPTKITKVGWRTITTKTFIMPNGETTTFDLLHPDGQEFATVVALTPDNKVVTICQYRPSSEKVMTELPGGFVDPGETPEVAVRRELLEETGYKAGPITYLGKFYKDAYMNSVEHAFLARDSVKVLDPVYDAEEEIEVKVVDIETFLEGAKKETAGDHATTLLAYDLLKEIQAGG